MNYKHPNKRLKNSEIVNMRNAFINSMYLNAPLNRHLTVNVEEITGQVGYQKILKGIRDMYTKYAKSRGFQSAFLMVVESGNIVGLHLHILFHMPANAERKFINEFKKRVATFLMKQIRQNSLENRSFHFGSLNYGRNLNRVDYYRNLCRLCDDIVERRKTVEVNELRRYHSVPPDAKRQYFADDSCLINIFNYLCKGISEHSQGAFNCRRFTCSRWLKDEPKALRYLIPSTSNPNLVIDCAA